MTPFETKVLAAINALDSRGRCVTYRKVENHVQRSQSQVHAAVNQLIRFGRVKRSRALSRGVWVTALTPAAKPEIITATKITMCPPGYADGYGWDVHPEDPKWRS